MVRCPLSTSAASMKHHQANCWMASCWIAPPTVTHQVGSSTQNQCQVGSSTQCRQECRHPSMVFSNPSATSASFVGLWTGRAGGGLWTGRGKRHMPLQGLSVLTQLQRRSCAPRLDARVRSTPPNPPCLHARVRSSSCDVSTSFLGLTFRWSKLMLPCLA